MIVVQLLIKECLLEYRDTCTAITCQTTSSNSSTSAQLILKNSYQTENTYDRMVLKYSINRGTTWQDILNRGRTFVSGGHNGTLSTCSGNPLLGR